MRKRWIVLIVVALVAAAGGVFAYWASSRTSDGLRHILDARREAGEPVTYAEIQARRAPITGDGETVADVISRIAELVVASPGPTSQGVFGDGDGVIGEFFDGISSEKIERSRKYLEARRPALLGLDAIANMEAGRFEISYEGNYIDAFISQAPPLRRILKLLLLDATIKLIDHDTEAAVAHVPLFFRIISPLVHEPDMIAQLTRMAAAQSSAKILQSGLRVGTLDDATLANMDEEFRSFLALYTMKWSLWGERAGMLELHEARVGSPGLKRAILLVAFSGDKDKGVGFLNSLIDTQDDPAKLLRAAKKIKGDLVKLSKRHLVTKLFAESLPNYVRIHVQCLAVIRAIRLLIAVERFRLRNDRMPAALDELVPTYIDAIPIDPFDQTPLKLITRDAMLIVYSVGDDGVDDGGQVVPVEGKKRPRDRGFRLLPVADRGVVFRDEINTSDDP